MRCPKCGFHSFDYLDSCKKCGVDLTEQKLRCKFQGYVVPAPGDEAPEPEPDTIELPEEAEAEEEAIDFGFDILAEESAPAPPDFANAPGEPDGDFAGFAAVEPAAPDLAADSGLSLDQPFAAENESLPDDDLPKLDDRFKF